MNNKKYSSGFALVEVAVALIVISIALGGMFTLMKLLKAQQQSEISSKHEQMIVVALNRFYHLNGYLPCPSKTNSNVGEALTQCQGASQQIGLLPFKTLGVSETISKNGAGFHFTYAVSQEVSVAPSAVSTPVTGNRLEILDEHGREYSAFGSCFAFLLINHGKHGRGAFSSKLERHRFAASNAFEIENSSDSLRFYVSKGLPNHSMCFRVMHDLTPPVTTPGTPASTVMPEDADLLDDPYADM